LRIEVYPAFDGDCLLLTGPGTKGCGPRILVDGGRAGTYSTLSADLSSSYGPASPIDLVVVTHVDADHITGILTLARHAPVGIREIWFNGHGHLRKLQSDETLVPLGPAQGDKLSALIEERGWPWNRQFGSGAVMTGPDPGASVRSVGDLTVTVLGPTAEELVRLERTWTRTIAEAGLSPAAQDLQDPGPGLKALGGIHPPDVEALAAAEQTLDRAVVNGSSIAMLVESAGKRILLAADAHPTSLEQSIAPLAKREGGRLRVDLLKVSHHGSRDNTTGRLLDLLDCRRFLFSTDGSRHGHPHPETIARILTRTAGRKSLYFNYDRPHTRIWATGDLTSAYDYEAVYPTGAEGRLTIEV